MNYEEDIKNLSEADKRKLLNALREKRKLQTRYRIAQYKPISSAQEMVISGISKAVKWESQTKIIWANGGNGSGKSGTGAFCVSSLALWDLTDQIGARNLGSRKKIAIFVESFDGVKKIEEYMFSEPTFEESSWHAGLCRIPPEFIKDIQYSQSKPKAMRFVELTNGTTIEFRTFGQGQKSAAGGNYDLVWIDEPPDNKNTFDEIIARASRKHCIILLTATLATEKEAFVEEFFDTMPTVLKDKTEIYTLLSIDNPYADTDVLRALGEERLTGRKSERKGKVYHQFATSKHTVEYFEPTVENMGGAVKHYLGIDPGWNHPFALIFFCMDETGLIYIYREMSLTGDAGTIGNVMNIIQQYNRMYLFDGIIVDSRDRYFEKSIRTDLGLANVKYADKSTKWPTGETNIQWRRMRINEFFKNNKIIIANTCPIIIRQFSRMKYKNNIEENSTAKSDVFGKDDDCVDAFGYAFDFATKRVRIFKTMENRDIDLGMLFPPKEEKKTKSWSEYKSLNYAV